MSDEDAAFAGGTMLGLLIASATWGIGGCVIDSSWRGAATERGYGQFNQKTGKWEWIEPVKKAEEEPK